jgi:hypothetical protein
MLHMTAPPPDPRDFRPDISPALANVIMKTLAKEPGDRYPSGRALADALETAVKVRAVAPIVDGSTLSIMDRVALEREVLPQIPAAVTPKSDVFQSTRPISAPAAVPMLPEEPTIDVVKSPPQQPISESPLATGLPPGSNLKSCLRVTVIGVVLFLLLVAALYLSGIGQSVIAAITDGTSQVETAETREVLANDSTPTAFVTKAAESSPTAVPTSLPGEVFMPVVPGEGSGDGGQTEETVILPLSSPTNRLLPTDSPQPTATVPSVYQLLIIANKEDSIFLVNQSAEPFPLQPLHLENDAGGIQGNEWGVVVLQPGECVAIWKEGGNPNPPDVQCIEVGDRVTRDGPNRFWKDRFNIIYRGELIGDCDPNDPCLVQIII